MQIFTKIEALKAFLKQKRANKQTIGLVPTMGALHAGHLSLVESSGAENQVTIGTVYVNPTQFNNAGDLAKYPRSIESDMALLEKGGCDALFYPDNQEMHVSHETIYKTLFIQTRSALKKELQLCL
jgi:pantoate--beta-alanine ligase